MKNKGFERWVAKFTLLLFAILLVPSISVGGAGDRYWNSTSRFIPNGGQRGGWICDWMEYEYGNSQFCNDDIWFLGQNSAQLNPDVERYYYGVPNWDLPHNDVPAPGTSNQSYVVGTDLGVSATGVLEAGGNSYKYSVIYMGDTWGCTSTHNCFLRDWSDEDLNDVYCDNSKIVSMTRLKPEMCDEYDSKSPKSFTPRQRQAIKKYFCDDAVAMVWEGYEHWNHVATQKFTYDGTVRKGFAPVVMSGINKYGTMGGKANAKAFAKSRYGTVNVPTGVTSYNANGTNLFLLWYGLNTMGGNPSSWLTYSYVSEESPTNSNLVEDFQRCPIQGRAIDTPFSEEKFIVVNPVPIKVSQIDNVCQNHSSSILCKAAIPRDRDGALLYGVGAGSDYRDSSMWLAYMYINNYGKMVVKYAAGDIWVNNESDAQPIIEAGSDDLYRMGEFSVGLVVPNSTQVFEPHIVMLSFHILRTPEGLDGAHPIQIRSAPLYEPDAFDAPQSTAGYGYGPNIIPEYTEVKSDNTLNMVHIASSWLGQNTWSQPGESEDLGIAKFRSSSCEEEETLAPVGYYDGVELPSQGGGNQEGWKSEPYGTFTRYVFMGDTQDPPHIYNDLGW